MSSYVDTTGTYPLSITINVLTYFTYILKSNLYYNFAIGDQLSPIPSNLPQRYLPEYIESYISVNSVTGQLVINRSLYTSDGPFTMKITFQKLMPPSPPTPNYFESLFVLEIIESFTNPPNIKGSNNNFFLEINTSYNFLPSYSVVSATTATNKQYALFAADTTGGLYQPFIFSTTLPNLLNFGALGNFSGNLTIFSTLPLTQYQIEVQDSLSYSYTYAAISVDITPVFRYPYSPYIFVPGEQINIFPIISSGAIGVIYAISTDSPGLPTGVTINTYNGTISGIVTDNVLSSNTYTVLATSSSGGTSYSTTLVIIINISPNFTYPYSQTLIQGLPGTIVPSSYDPYNPPQANRKYQYQLRISPPQKAHTNAIFRTAENIIFFGDTDNNSNDVWNFDSLLNRWSNLTVLDSVRPPVRFDANMIYNSTTDQILLFGGFTYTSVYDPNGGTDGTPISPLYPYYYNDTWIYDCITKRWTQIYKQNKNALGQPSVRSKAAMVYDSLRNQAILFGGCIFAGYDEFLELIIEIQFNDTWIFDFGSLTWQNIIPGYEPTSPPYRDVAVLSYTTASDKVLLFGGRYFDTPNFTYSYYNDTWSYDPVLQQWSQLTVVNPPSIRGYASSVYSVENNITIVYGGYNGDTFGGVLTESYYFNHANNTWTFLINVIDIPTAPFFVTDISKVGILPLININGTKFILFNYQDVYTLEFNFSLNSGTWTELITNPTYANYPPLLGNDFQSYAYNENSRNILSLANASVQPWVLDLDTKTWTQVGNNPQCPTLNTQDQCVVYCSITDEFFVFGGLLEDLSSGYSQYFPTNNTWIYKLQTNTWQQIISPISPIARYNFSMVFYPGNNCVYIFGGSNDLYGNLNDMWLFDFNLYKWNQVIPTLNRSPQFRSQASFTYHAGQNVLILFGGLSGISFQVAINANDVWSFDPNINLWTELIPNGTQGSPTGRSRNSMVYVPKAQSFNSNNLLIMYGGTLASQGGFGYQTFFNDTWSLTLAENGNTIYWENLNVTNAPIGYKASDFFNYTYFFVLVYDYINNTLFNSNLNIYRTLSALITPVPPYAPLGVIYEVTGKCPLPLGLTINPFTGIISGAPTIQTPPRTYTVTGTNTIGSSSANFIIFAVRPYLGSRAESLCTTKDIMRLKGDVLQYTANKQGMSRSIQWSQTVRTGGAARKRGWASQSDKNTNPNLNKLPVAQNNLNLICPSNPIICKSTTASNVPGTPQQLCYNTSLPILLNRTVRTFTLNGTKWPQFS